MMTATTQQPQAALPRAGTGTQYLTFMLGADRFAMSIVTIKEIMEYGPITPVPMMPPSVTGVMNLRGAVVPVVDLAICFGRSPTAIGRRTCIVIVDLPSSGGRQQLGLVVDAVVAVLDIAPADIEPPPPFGAGMSADYIAGMARHDGGFVVVVNVPQVLGSLEAVDVAMSSETVAAP